MRFERRETTFTTFKTEREKFLDESKKKTFHAFATFKRDLMKITLDPKQLKTLKETLNSVINVAGKIAAEMKRANDLKEKELKTRGT